MPTTTPQHGKGSNIPAVGVEFELTLTTPIDSLDMVKWAGYNPEGWKYNGMVFVPATQRFTLVQAGYQPNLDGVRRKQGVENVPQGHWLKAFQEAYPSNDGKGPIGVADASWERPYGLASFPILFELGGAWRRDFLWVGSVLYDVWRWLRLCK